MLPDGLVIVEGSNGSGKTTFADLIYFGLGGLVKQFGKKGNEQHKEIRDDSNNSVHLTIEIDGGVHHITRRFDAPEDVLVASEVDERAVVLAVARKGSRQILSDWILDALGIAVVTLFFGSSSGKLNLTDVMRLMYHNQEADPSRVFKKADNENYVTDSRDFRHAIFEILIGKASEEYYETLGQLKTAQLRQSDSQAALEAYKSAISRASADRKDANAEFLRKDIEEREQQEERLHRARTELRRSAPDLPAADSELLRLRQSLASAEVAMSETQERASGVRGERIRLMSLEEQLRDEAVRIQKIIHAHEKLSLFSPDTCPCCLRKVDRAQGHCICNQTIDEAAYQRFFYSPEEYLSILKSKQKNVETVRDALKGCDTELRELAEQLANQKKVAGETRKRMLRWAGIGGVYSTELQRVDDALVEVRVVLERLRQQLDLELERDKLEAQANAARNEVTRLTQRLRSLDSTAQSDRTDKIAQFDKIYTRLMRETLKEVRVARLDADYEPVINDGEYREASATVTRRLMYYLTLLEMSLADAEMPFPRFLLVDTPETAGIDRENLQRAIGKIAKVLDSSKMPAQVVLTTGESTYPADLHDRCLVKLTDDDRLLKRKAEPEPSALPPPAR
jgi:chromosome segregation ATPase